MFAIYGGAFAGLTVLARKKGAGFGKKLLFWIMTATFAVYCIYKAILVWGSGYSEVLVAGGREPACIWTELPFQLCNINLILIPVGLLFDSKPILSFSMYMAPVGALLALIMPSYGFNGYNMFLPRMLGYYITHFIILFGGLAVCSFGIVEPRLRDFPATVITMLLLTVFTFLINFALRKTGLAPAANFFYSMNPDGNPVLELFYGWIPVPLLYEISALLILVPYMFFYLGVFSFVKRKKPGGEDCGEAAQV